MESNIKASSPLYYTQSIKDNLLIQSFRRHQFANELISQTREKNKMIDLFRMIFTLFEKLHR